MYTAIIEDGRVTGYGIDLEKIGALTIEITKEQYDNIILYGNNYYIYNNGLIVNPNYEQEQEQKEQDRINNLTMTSLDFINFVKSLGVTDLQIEIYLNEHINVKHQLQYCQNVYCGVAKQLMPITIGEVTITADMVEQVFKIKNGEI